MTKTSKSNFGKYFLYKLAQNKPVIFIYALLNFLTAVAPQIMMYRYYLSYGEPNEDAFGIMRFSIIICVIVITVNTVKSMRIYHDRSAMDTLGCLPLSYGERFWGDLLSGMCANFISLVPFCIISLVFQNLYSMIMLLVIISYIGVYAFTAFISSCCGKFGTSVVYSFVAMLVLPGVYWVYANYFYSNAVGADPYWEICSKVGMLPPFGWVLSIVMRKFDPFISYKEKINYDYLINRPICFIVPILIIAAILLGAYFIGKKRKAEKTGEGFMFKSVFYVLGITLLVLVIGLTTLQTFESKTIRWAIILPLALLLYSAIEVSQNNGFRGFWKAVIRFAAVVGVSVAFMAVIKSTNSFGYYKTLPSESSIKEVRVAGEYFFSEDGISIEITYHTYKSDESVSTILSEHKKLLDTEGLKTGHKLLVVYATKGGKEIHRGYTVEDNIPDGYLPIKNFSDTVNGLQEFDPSVLGVIGGSDFTKFNIEYSPSGSTSIIISNDKAAELAEILSSDIKNYYFDDSSRTNTVGTLRFRNKSDRNDVDYYMILNVYEDTLEFLNDPANCIDPIEESSVEYFNVTYRTKGDEGMLSDISVTVSTDDTNEYAKELRSYIEITNRIDHTPPCFIIEDSDGHGGYKISPENEKAAIKAMLDLLRESNS